MGIGGTLYNIFLKRTSTFTVVVVASAFVFERSFDVAADKIFDTINKGVSTHFSIFYISIFISLILFKIMFDTRASYVS